MKKIQMTKRGFLTRKLAGCCIAALLLLLSAAGPVRIPGMSVFAHASSIPQGAFDPDSYAGVTYTVRSNSETASTSEITKLYSNIFYYKDEIIVEDTHITDNQSGNSYRFNLVSYDDAEEFSDPGGFATLKALADKGIVEITEGVALDDTLGDKIKGTTTIRRIRFIHPDYIVKLSSSLSNSSHPGYSGQQIKDGKFYLGIISNIDHAAVYSAKAKLDYYTDEDLCWQDGSEKTLPFCLYAPMPGASYSITIPHPVKSGYHVGTVVDDPADPFTTGVFSDIAEIVVQDQTVTVSSKSIFYDSHLDGSDYSSGKLQILGSDMDVIYYAEDGSTVNFYPNGGSIPGIAEGSDCYIKEVESARTYTKAELDELISAPSRAGYTFAGWAIRGKDGNSKVYHGEDEDLTEIQAGYYQAASYTFPKLSNTSSPIVLDLYAVWTAEQQKTCTVAFSANGHGVAPAAQTVTTGQTASRPSDPSAGGFVFGGWYKEAACTNAYDFNAAVTSDLTLYAKWTAAPTPTAVPSPTPTAAPSPTPTAAPDPEAITIKQAPKILTAARKNKKVTVTWKKIPSGNAGKKLLSQIRKIQVQTATNKKFTKNITVQTVGKKKTKAVVKLKKNKTIYLRVRYVGKDGGYSKWSTVKKVKVK